MFLFVTYIFWVIIQTRRQDFAAEGTKNHNGEAFFKYDIGYLQQPGDQI